MPLLLSLFGSFQLVHNQQPIQFPLTTARALLSYLALEAERPHGREVLAALMWPDQGHSAAFANLRQTLARMRKMLAEHAAIGAMEGRRQRARRGTL